MALLGLYYNKCNEFLLMDPTKICLALVKNVLISVVTKMKIKRKNQKSLDLKIDLTILLIKLGTYLVVIRAKSNSAFNYLRTFYTLLFYAWK